VVFKVDETDKERGGDFHEGKWAGITKARKGHLERGGVGEKKKRTKKEATDVDQKNPFSIVKKAKTKTNGKKEKKNGGSPREGASISRRGGKGKERKTKRRGEKQGKGGGGHRA